MHAGVHVVYVFDFGWGAARWSLHLCAQAFFFWPPIGCQNRARAIENQCYVLAVNRLGENPNGDTYSGGSVVLDYLGQPMVDCGDRLMAASAGLSMEELEKFRAYFPAAMDQDDFELKL